MTPYWTSHDGRHVLYHGDCLVVMPTIAAASIDAVITDPPYFKVKGEAWDNQWTSPAKFIAWLEEVAKEWRRLLKPNGSIYCFASPQMAARVEVMLSGHFEILNHLVWVKPGGWQKRACKEELRGFFPQTERIIFAEQKGADLAAKGLSQYASKCAEARAFIFEPLRAYLASEWKRAGLKCEQANEACGTASMAARHYFATSQWCLPTQAHYKRLQEYANRQAPGDYLRREYDYLRREYEDLRREYEDLRREYEDLRRPFAVTRDVPYTDVWRFQTVPPGKGKHICEKPGALLEHIISTSTKPGAVVLDCFAGSGATGEACYHLGRQFIGIEKCARNAQIASTRCASVAPRLI